MVVTLEEGLGVLLVNDEWLWLLLVEGLLEGDLVSLVVARVAVVTVLLLLQTLNSVVLLVRLVLSLHQFP